MTNSEAPPSEGLIAGKYTLVRMIGRGGMGSVWEARHVTLNTRIAIKFIESEYANSEEARSRFDKEALAAATIQSKHAIQIYDHGVTDDGKPYIVMELLTGEPLDKRIDRLCRMSLQDTAKILQQVCRGLSHAHERGIIHRDLKPENIFLVRNTDDDEEIAKVLDFGIAKMQSGPGSPGVSSSTKTGAVLGTPFYMSPEQARGLRSVDHRTDVWSLAVIAFKCVTGKLPFDGESVGDLLVKICTAPVPIPSQVVPGIPPNFDAWFMRAMERDPERRFANVTELADALCFAAGIATRSAQGAPISALATVSAGGVITPPGLAAMGSGMGNGMGSGMTPGMTPGGSQPGYASQGYGQSHGHQPMHAGMRTPAPGAMTNAPFTKEHIPGVPSGRGKLVVGGIFASVLAVSLTVALVLVLRKPSIVQSDPANAVTGPPAVSTVAATSEPSADPTTAPTPDVTPTAAVAATPTAVPKTPGKTPAPTPKSTAKALTGPTVTVPPLPPATAITPPTPTKKPNKNDPGY